MTIEGLTPGQRRQLIYDNLDNARAEYRRAVSKVMTMALSSDSMVVSEAEKLGLGLTGSIKVAKRLGDMAEQIHQHIGEPIISFKGEFGLRKTTGILGIIADEPFMVKYREDKGHYFSVPVISPVGWNDNEVKELDSGPISIEIARIEALSLNSSNSSIEDPLIEYDFTDFTNTRPSLTVFGIDNVYRQAKEMPKGSLKIFSKLYDNLFYFNPKK